MPFAFPRFWTQVAAWVDADWWRGLISRIEPWHAEASPPEGPLLAPHLLWLALGLGICAVGIPPVWRAVRIGVTYVHELGHAVVGMLCGRRFTGFVVRGDMSGHAVTVGRSRGFGLIATTWAGYPAPALAAWGATWAAVRGWAPLIWFVIALGSTLALVFVRSWGTLAVTAVVAASSGALWWWREDVREAAALLVIAMVLLLGAWRHVVAVAGSPRGSDPAELARQTRLPGWFWVGTQLAAILGASAGVVRLTLPLLGVT